MKILKFGGTSVESSKNIKKVIDIITHASRDDIKPVIVVSALSGITDQLIVASNLALNGDVELKTVMSLMTDRHLQIVADLVPVKHRGGVIASLKNNLNDLEDLLQGIATLGECSPRIRDRVLSYGELLSATILSEVLSVNYLPAQFIDSREVIRTNDNFGAARVDIEVSGKLIRDRIDGVAAIPVFPGFIGATLDGVTTTLGRGGSDYTASVVGVGLSVDEIEIWTDVDGVMTADPRLVSDALSISQLSYEEAMELSHFGAKVIYPPTIQPAYEARIPLRIRNTFNPEFPGTLICNEPGSHPYMVTGISSITKIAFVRVQGPGMQGVMGTARRVFEALSRKGVNVVLISQASSEHTICFAIDPTYSKVAESSLSEEFSVELGKKALEPIFIEEDCSILSIVGESMRSMPGISGRLFGSLGRNGINVIAIAQGSSELNISVVIKEKDRKKALNAVHDTFFLSLRKRVSAFIIGDGLIGGTLLKQIHDHKSDLMKRYHVDIEVRGLTNTTKMVVGDDPIPWSNFDQLLDTKGEQASLDEFIDQMIALSLPNTVLVDCSASEVVPKYYSKVLNASISVVTPNKKGLSGDLALYNEIKQVERSRGSTFLYETSVGAGLPVIGTLKDLMKSGDAILEIEAVLSGTLSYIFNNFTADGSFAAIVKKASELGYTEPDPRDDLSGTDVARKLLILAREIGINLSLSDVSVESLVPVECMKCSKDQFLLELEKHQREILVKNRNAHSEGKKLCYIASIRNGVASTSLEVIGSDHPFFNLSGSDNIISFRTRRYDARPLVVKGPGAGAEVTAAGVFADILRIVS